MSLERFCRKEIATVRPTESVISAARTMKEKHVGALVVIDAARRPVGLITDRDITCRIVAAVKDPVATPVESAMSGQLVTIRDDATIDEAACWMRRNGVRRLPIVDRTGKVVGLVAFDDLVVLLSAALRETTSTLQENRGP